MTRCARCGEVITPRFMYCIRCKSYLSQLRKLPPGQYKLVDWVAEDAEDIQFLVRMRHRVLSREMLYDFARWVDLAGGVFRHESGRIYQLKRYEIVAQTCCRTKYQ